MVGLRYVIFLLVILPLVGGAQTVVFSVPEKLSAAINTPCEESFPLLSPDGKTLFFTRSFCPENTGGKFTGSDIWISQYDVKTRGWTQASNTEDNLNNKGNNAIAGISNDGRTVYLLNTTSSKETRGIYFSKKVNNTSWSRPELISIPGIEPENFLGLYVSPDFDVVFLSMKAADSRGEEDLYVSFKDVAGQWSMPKNLGPSINTTGFEISPFLSADKKKLYFSSNGHNGLGDADVFYSERLYNSWEVWSVPKNMGNVINTANFEAYFSVYGDTVCFLSSNRGGGANATDIYRSRISIDDGQKEKQRIQGLVGETSALLDQLRSSTQSLTNIATSKVLIFFEGNSSELSPKSATVLKSFGDYLKQEGSKKIKIEYDGKLVDATRTAQLLAADRVRKVKQLLRSMGVAENRVVVMNNFFSTEAAQIRQNSFQISIQ